MNNNTKKKICYISYKKIRSSVIDNFSKAVCNAGYDVSVITLRNDGEPEFEIDNGRKMYRISLHDDYPVACRRNGLKFICKVIPIIKRNRFSIIQITTTCPYFILLRLLSFHYAKSIFHILSYPIATSFIRSLKRMIVTSIQCYFLDKIVVQSEELKINWIGLSKLEKAVVIPVGFNKNDFYPIELNQRSRIRTELGLKNNQPILVYCGVISHHRHIDQLIVAFKKIASKHKNIKLMMVGDGVALANIQALTRRFNLEERIIFTGRIPYAEVRSLIAMADIGLSYIPINNNYNFNPPLKTFEYMACGLPTIATKTESNCKIIKNGHSGILVNDAPDDFADAIDKLLVDKDLQNRLSRNARNSVLKYDFNHITQTSFLPLYDELLTNC